MNKSEKSIAEQIELYLEYLKELKGICNNPGIKFKLADRVLYEADKRLNKDIKLKNY